MHTAGVDGEAGDSLDRLEQVAPELGRLVLPFGEDLSRYQTVELPSEATKRARNSDFARSSGPGVSKGARQEANANSRRRSNELNISTAPPGCCGATSAGPCSDCTCRLAP